MNDWKEQLPAIVAASLSTGEYATALGASQEALCYFIEHNDADGQALALFQFSLIYEQQEQTAEALEVLSRCLALYQGIGDRQGVGRTLRGTGKILMLRNDNAGALDYFERSVIVLREVGDEAGEAGALNNVANIYKLTGDIAISLEIYQQSLAIFERIGNQIGAAQLLLNIANTYNVLESPETALSYGLRGWDVFQTCGGDYHKAVTLNIIGTTYSKMKQPQNALEYYQRSIAIAEPMNLGSLIAFGYADMGEAYIALGRFDEAEKALSHSLVLNKKEDYQRSYSEGLARLGSLYMREEFSGHSYETALSLLQEARDIAIQLDSPTILSPVYTALTDLHERCNRYPEALACLRLQFEMERRIFNEESDRRVKQMETRAKVEKARKDAEIAHLRNVELAEALAEAEQLREAADRRARTDGLTGLLNRRYLDEKLASEWEKSLLHDRVLTVALTDIDYFKKINDRFGHGIGDEALRRVARLLQEESRSAHDIVARYGGEEFAILLPETDATVAYQVCERIRSRIEAADWEAVASGLKVTISIGIATSGGTANDTVANPGVLLEMADRQLYRSKSEGRNRVSC